MKILLICYVYPPEAQSAGSMTQSLAEDLARAGHDVTVVTGIPSFPRGELFDGWIRRWKLTQRVDGYRLVRVWHALGMRKSLAHRLLYYATFSGSLVLHGLTGGPVDCIFDISPPLVGNSSTWLLSQIKRARHYYVNWDVYPEIALDTGLLSPGLASRLIGHLDTFLGNHCTRVLVVADAMRRVLEGRGVRPEQIAVLPNWIDMTPEPLPVRLNAWRRSHGIPDDAFVVLYAGTIGQMNGAEVLVDAARELAATPNLLVLFVGDGEAADRVRKQAEGVRNVRFLPMQPRESMAEVHAAADVCIATLLPGRGQLCAPSKTLGYMDAARPVVACADADSVLADWVREAGCGTVVPASDPRELARALVRLMDDPDLARRMGQAGRAYARKHFARERVIPLYQALLTGVGPEDEPAMNRTPNHGASVDGP